MDDGNDTSGFKNKRAKTMFTTAAAKGATTDTAVATATATAATTAAATAATTAATAAISTATTTAAATATAIATGTAARTLTTETTTPFEVGLKNLYNTCYMNAVLQCLIHTQPLKDYLMGLDGAINKILVNSLSSVFQVYFSRLVRVIEPRQFVTTFKTMPDLAANFNNDSQQDAVNFLLSLLDALHLELNGSSVISRWDEFVLQNNIIIIDNFMVANKVCYSAVFVSIVMKLKILLLV
jgi:hypothetical protein